jgi:hypothetical protein
VAVVITLLAQPALHSRVYCTDGCVEGRTCSKSGQHRVAAGCATEVTVRRVGGLGS